MDKGSYRVACLQLKTDKQTWNGMVMVDGMLMVVSTSLWFRALLDLDPSSLSNEQWDLEESQSKISYRSLLLQGGGLGKALEQCHRICEVR